MYFHQTIALLSLFHPDIWKVDAFAGFAPSTLLLKKCSQSSGALYSTIPGVRPVNGGPAINGSGASVAPSQSWNIANPVAAPKPSGILKTKQEVWESAPTVVIQGGSLRTCSFNESVDRVQVLLNTEGRPLNSSVELWQGPDNCPQRINVYIEDGSQREFRCLIETPRGSNAVCIRNTAHMEFPLTACVDAAVEDIDGNFALSPFEVLEGKAQFKTVQGGAVNTTPFGANVQSVQVMLKTDGRPLNARIELLQGPNNNKQVMDLYIEDGMDRPFYAIIDTPGSGNVVRIVNTSTVEFPLVASVTAYEEDTYDPQSPSSGAGLLWSD